MPTRDEILISQIERFNQGTSVQSRFFPEGLAVLAKSDKAEDIMTLLNALNKGILEHVRMQAQIGPLVSKLSRVDTNHSHEALRTIFTDPICFPRVASAHKQTAFESLMSSISTDRHFTLHTGITHGLLDQIHGEVLSGYIGRLLDEDQELIDQALVSLFSGGALARMSEEQREILKVKISELSEARASSLLDSIELGELRVNEPPTHPAGNGIQTIATLGVHKQLKARSADGPAFRN